MTQTSISTGAKRVTLWFKRVRAAPRSGRLTPLRRLPHSILLPEAVEPTYPNGEWKAEHVAEYKVSRYIKVREEMQYRMTLKVLKRILRVELEKTMDV